MSFLKYILQFFWCRTYLQISHLIGKWPELSERTSLDDNKWVLNRDVEHLSKYLQFMNAIFLWNFSAIGGKKHHYNFKHPDNKGQVPFFAMELLSILSKNTINIVNASHSSIIHPYYCWLRNTDLTFTANPAFDVLYWMENNKLLPKVTTELSLERITVMFSTDR